MVQIWRPSAKSLQRIKAALMAGGSQSSALQVLGADYELEVGERVILEYTVLPSCSGACWNGRTCLHADHLLHKTLQTPRHGWECAWAGAAPALQELQLLPEDWETAVVQQCQQECPAHHPRVSRLPGRQGLHAKTLFAICGDCYLFLCRMNSSLMFWKADV